jgi:ATP-binding cassette subfamily F protein 3
LIISHDRELLNNSVEAILHLSQGKLELYSGGYNAFETRRAEKTRLQVATKAKQDAERAHLQRFIDRFRAKASKATQAQSRIKRLAKLEPIAEVVEERVAPFTLPSPTRPLAPPLIQLDGATAGYDGTPVLRNLNLRLDVDDRIGLLGVNGAGKTTFAKMVAGALPLQSGRMNREQRIRVGWFHQHQIEALDPDDTPLDILRRERPEDSESARRSRLAQFGLAFDKQDTTVANLSGGERARLLLNLVAMAAPHLLILDEPTNHLDIESRRALLDALNDYEGAVILITHDRSLIELVADRLWLTADGHIKPFAGDMDDYARFILDRVKVRMGPSPRIAREQTTDLVEIGVATREQEAAAAARLAAKKAAKKRRRRGY